MLTTPSTPEARIARYAAQQMREAVARLDRARRMLRLVGCIAADVDQSLDTLMRVATSLSEDVVTTVCPRAIGAATRRDAP